MKSKWTRSRGGLLSRGVSRGIQDRVARVDKGRIRDENVGHPFGWGPEETVAGIAL